MSNKNIVIELNEHSNLTTLADNLKKKVRKLLRVYASLIIQTILLFLFISIVVVLIGIGIVAKGDGSIDSRILYLLLATIGVAAAALWAVLKPLFGIFKAHQKKGVEVRREDNPELFTAIDEIVKAVDCQYPKHVYVSNECNAYVYNPSIWGYMKKDGGRQNLTIGLPLLYSMNVTEMKSILAHEFGHFTQHSIQMNRIANLSEFICGSFLRSQKEMEEADDRSIKRYAKGYIREVGKVLMKQYYKVAPLNGVLSRAQEFDADHYSQKVIGTEGSVSALSKLSYISSRWGNFYQILTDFAMNDKRAPEDVYDAFAAFASVTDELGAVKLEINVPLTEPSIAFPSRLGPAANTETHPSSSERVDAIKSYEPVDTEWDYRPALDLFPKETVHSIFNSVVTDIENALYMDYTTIPTRRDIKKHDIIERFEGANPSLFNYFYNDGIFFLPDSAPDELNHGTYQDNPFTWDNAMRIGEYHTAQEDYDTLVSIREENFVETKFRYLDKQYDGTCVPVDLHESYFLPLKENALAIAKHCNWWLEEHARQKGKANVYHLFRSCWVTDRRLMGLMDSIKQVSYFIQNDIKEPDAMKYVEEGVEVVREIVTPLFMKDSKGQTEIDMAFDYAQITQEEREAAYDFIKAEHPDAQQLVNGFMAIGKSTYAAKTLAWRELVHEVILEES